MGRLLRSVLYFPRKEDLVFWRLGSFEDDLMSSVRDRAPGESLLTAFGSFLMRQRGLLGHHDPAARDELVALTRMIQSSPALRARESQILSDYTAALADLIGTETRARENDVRPRVAAHAMMGVHRALIDYSRSRILAGGLDEKLPRDVRAQAKKALALLDAGFGEYGRA